MGRTKLKKLQKLIELPNVFNSRDKESIIGFKDYFYDKKYVTLEIGCGHGDYSVELARIHSERNFVGIDVKGARLYRGASIAIDAKLKNVAFIITKAEKLNQIFEPNSIEEIYIPFPDPHVKLSKQNRRLISPALLNIYKQLVIDSAKIHFKTDNKFLFEFAIESIKKVGAEILYLSEDLHNGDLDNFNSTILTSYEKYYLKEGRIISYICFGF